MAGCIGVAHTVALWPAAARWPDGPCHNRAVAVARTELTNLVRLAAGFVVVATGLGALAVAEGPGGFTTYAGSYVPAAVLTLVAGFALVGAGLVVSFTRPEGRVGDLAILAAFVWFAPVWVGWQDGPALLRSLGMVAAGFTFPLLVHGALAHPSGRLGSKAARALMVAVYAEAAVAAVVLALIRDPYFDPGCWSNCTVNTFLVPSMPSLARAVQMTDRWFLVAATAALATTLVWRLVRESGPARVALAPVAVPAMLLAGAVAAHSIALQAIPVEDPTDLSFLSIFVATSSAVILLGAGLALAALRTRSQRRAVARMVNSLGEAPSPGSLESALSGALGDPDLGIAYWLPSSERYVDANGRPVDEPTPEPGRVVTTLVHDERPIAIVSHAGTLPELERELGPAVRLGLENERLQAEVLAQLDEIRASRARIVETGDTERRRLERDLHDGAQQRLLALSFDIRLARAAAEAQGEGQAQSQLTEAVGETQTALAELREIAHGIFPAILAEAGLTSALETLADSAPIPVEIRGAAEGRLLAPVEMAAYVLVTEALDDAIARGATRVMVATARADDRLVVTADGDGPDRISSMVAAADRVGAVGGTLEVEPTRVRADIPCA
jgi:signal transduction histidine kinase